MFDLFHSQVPDRTSLHERKLHAWALVVGVHFNDARSADKAVRPHRGMLPDLDPSMVVPDPSYRPWLRRFIAYVRWLAGPVEALEIAPAALLSASVTTLVGKAAPTPYSADAETLHPVAAADTDATEAHRAAA